MPPSRASKPYTTPNRPLPPPSDMASTSTLPSSAGNSPSVAPSSTAPGSLSPTLTARSETLQPPSPTPPAPTMALPEVDQATSAGNASSPQQQDLLTLLKDMNAKMDGMATQASICSLNYKLERTQQAVDSIRSIAIASALHARSTDKTMTAILEILSRLDAEPVVDVAL